MTHSPPELHALWLQLVQQATSSPSSSSVVIVGDELHTFLAYIEEGGKLGVFRWSHSTDYWRYQSCIVAESDESCVPLCACVGEEAMWILCRISTVEAGSAAEEDEPSSVVAMMCFPLSMWSGAKSSPQPSRFLLDLPIFDGTKCCCMNESTIVFVQPQQSKKKKSKKKHKAVATVPPKVPATLAIVDIAATKRDQNADGSAPNISSFPLEYDVGAISSVQYEPRDDVLAVLVVAPLPLVLLSNGFSCARPPVWQCVTFPSLPSPLAVGALFYRASRAVDVALVTAETQITTSRLSYAVQATGGAWQCEGEKAAEVTGELLECATPPASVATRSDGQIMFFCNGNLLVLDVATQRCTAVVPHLASCPSPRPPSGSPSRSPARLNTVAHAAETLPSSRMLLHILPSEETTTRSHVTAALHSLLGRKNKPGTDSSPQVCEVEVDGMHPLQSQVAIDCAHTPLEVTVNAVYETLVDCTALNIEWIDPQRRVSVHLHQRVHLAEAKKAKYQQQFAELESAYRQLQNEQRESAAMRDEIAKETRALQQMKEEFERKQQEHESEVLAVQAARRALEEDRQKVEAEKKDIEAEKALQIEAEKEAEKRHRAERDKERQHERSMEAERKREAKAQEQLDRATEAQHEAQLKLERELERIGREREQHKRDSLWAKDRERAWTTEKAALEANITQLKEELVQIKFTADQLEAEKKATALVEHNLREDVKHLNACLDEYEGRLGGETDQEWSKRREVSKRAWEAGVKGRFAVHGIVLDTTTGSNQIAFVEGSHEPVHLFPNMTVAVELAAATILSASVDVEVGEGYQPGDELRVEGLKGSELEIHDGISGAKASMNEGRGDMWHFELVTEQGVSQVLQKLLRSIMFFSTSVGVEYLGARQVEFMVTLSLAKQSVQCAGFALATVTGRPLVPSSSRAALPFLERGDPVPVFGHLECTDPFSSPQDTLAMASFSHGLKGPASSPAVAVDERTARAYAYRYGGLLGHRCLTCQQLRHGCNWNCQGMYRPRDGPLAAPQRAQIAELQRKCFAGAAFDICLTKVQPEDEFVLLPVEFGASERNNSNTVEISLNASKDRITLHVLDAARSPSESLTRALHTIAFRCAASLLEAAPRCVTFSAHFPLASVPIRWNSEVELAVVNSDHEVTVEGLPKDVTYYYPSVEASGLSFPPTPLFLLRPAVVMDTLHSFFSGTITVRIQSHGDAGMAQLQLLSHPSCPLFSVSEASGLGSSGRPKRSLKYGNDVIGYGIEDAAGQSVQIDFLSRVDAVMAEAAIRSIAFTTTVCDTRKCQVALHAALGKGACSDHLISVNVEPPLVKVEKFGGIKWTEHQSAVLATSQFSLTRAKAVLPALSIHVFIADGGEEGDVIDLDTALPKVEIEVQEREVVLTSGGTSAPVTKAYLVDCRIPNALPVRAFLLADHSVVLHLAEPCDTQPSTGKLYTRAELATLEQVFARLTFIHLTQNPKNLKKVLCLRTEDPTGSIGNAYVPLAIVPVDDPTEIHDVPKACVFVQGSEDTRNGFQLVRTARLFDPDTEDFIGGFVSIEPTRGWTDKDELGILSVEEQVRRKLDYVIVAERDGRVFCFATAEEMVQWEKTYADAIVSGESKNDAVLTPCIGVLRKRNCFELASSVLLTSDSGDGALPNLCALHTAGHAKHPAEQSSRRSFALSCSTTRHQIWTVGSEGLSFLLALGRSRQQRQL